MTMPHRFLVACVIADDTSKVSPYSLARYLIRSNLAGDSNKDVRVTVIQDTEEEIFELPPLMEILGMSSPRLHLLLRSERGRVVYNIARDAHLGHSHLVLCVGSVAYCETFIQTMETSMTAPSGWTEMLATHVPGARSGDVYCVDAQSGKKIISATLAEILASQQAA